MSSSIANKVKTKMYLASIKLFIVLLSYVPLFKLYNTATIYLFDILPYTSILASTNNSSIDLYNSDLCTQRVFPQDGLNYYYQLPSA